MGADIHIVIEFDHTGADFLVPTGLTYMEWPRWTDLFVALGVFNGAAKVPSRGFPNPCSALAAQHYGLLVCEDGMLHEYGPERAIEEAEAITLVDAGRSHYLTPLYGIYAAISDPAFSYPNWITLKELETVCDSFSKAERSLSLECNATVLLLQHMQAQNVQSRMVYWFDV